MSKPLCSWCAGECDLELMTIPASPILEWMEEKIIAIDKDFSLDSGYELSDEEEDEISLYDSLINTMIKGHVCSSCWGKEQILWDKYYTIDPDDLDFDDDADLY